MGKRSSEDDGIRKNKKSRKSTNLMVLGKGMNKFIIHKEDYKTIGNILQKLNISNCLEPTQDGGITVHPHILRDMVEVAEDDDERRVVRLDVFNCNGSLPACIDELQSLRHLKLASTKFHGRTHSSTQHLVAIPEEIGKLSNLITLNLDGSGIASLPSGIGELQNLNDLKLSFTCNLVTLPEEIGKLSNLISLDLCGSGIASLPSGIGRLKSLKNLNLFETHDLVTLPTEIGNLTNLIALNLGGSRTASLPSGIGGLQSLKYLTLSHTKHLVTLPEEIGKLTNLISLDLYGSSIASLPSGIGGLQSLKDLDLSLTLNLVTLPEEIGNLMNLEYLNVYKSGIPSLPLSIRNKLGYTLACRTARARKSCFRTTSKGHVQDTVVLWPLVLRNARRAFEFDVVGVRAFIGYQCRHYSIGQYDAVYTILMDNIESFLRLLKNHH